MAFAPRTTSVSLPPFPTEAVDVTISRSDEPCSGQVIPGRLVKHCWKVPRPDGSAAYHDWWGVHASANDQPRDPLTGRYLPFMDNKGNLDSFSGLRLHHRSEPYYTNCIYLPEDADVRDGSTRSGNDYVWGPGDTITFAQCCGTSFQVVFVTREEHGEKAWKKAHLVRNSAGLYEDLPDEMTVTVGGQSQEINDTGTYWDSESSFSVNGNSVRILVTCAGLCPGDITVHGDLITCLADANDQPALAPLYVFFSVNGGVSWTRGEWVPANESLDPLYFDHWDLDLPVGGIVPLVISE